MTELTVKTVSDPWAKPHPGAREPAPSPEVDAGKKERFDEHFSVVPNFSSAVTKLRSTPNGPPPASAVLQPQFPN